MTKPAPRDASRRAHVAPFIAMDVMSAAKALGREGRSILHMEVGEPGAPTPQRVREAAISALTRDRISYTEALGMPALRERIARHYREAEGVFVSPERIVVTAGSSAGFILTFLALFDAGERVAIPRPGYPAYRNILAALGLETVEVATTAADRHALTAGALNTAHAVAELAGVLSMSPANPTGVAMDAAAMAGLTQFCARAGLWHLSDEIYHGLQYAGESVSALRFNDEAIVINSFSKYYCMTGWRIGWLVVPERLARVFERLQQNLSISVPYLSQGAALAAFEARDELEVIKAVYAQNRALLAEALPKLGLPHLPMDGAFYAYVDVGRYSNDSMDFCRRALNEAGVAITPGADFDGIEGHRFARISYAGSEGDVHGTIERLGAWLKV